MMPYKVTVLLFLTDKIRQKMLFIFFEFDQTACGVKFAFLGQHMDLDLICISTIYEDMSLNLRQI